MSMMKTSGSEFPRLIIKGTLDTNNKSTRTDSDCSRVFRFHDTRVNCNYMLENL